MSSWPRAHRTFLARIDSARISTANVPVVCPSPGMLLEHHDRADTGNEQRRSRRDPKPPQHRDVSHLVDVA
jgi:uncharacterized protein YraI